MFDLYCSYKPIKLFSFISTLFLIGSICCFISLFRSQDISLYTRSNLMLTALGSLLALCSIISFCSGVILHNVKNFYLRTHDILKKSMKVPTPSYRIKESDQESRIEEITPSYESTYRVIDFMSGSYLQQDFIKNKDKIIN